MLLISDVFSGMWQAMVVIYPLCLYKSGLKHAPGNRISSVHLKLWPLPGTTSSYTNVSFLKAFWEWNFQDSVASLSQFHHWSKFDECDVAMRRRILPIDSMKATVQSKTIWGKDGDFKQCFWISSKTVFLFPAVNTAVPQNSNVSIGCICSGRFHKVRLFLYEKHSFFLVLCSELGNCQSSFPRFILSHNLMKRRWSVSFENKSENHFSI